ncbi:5-hydroxytryptamine receptor 3A-like isoform X3 [Dicentrarchus labrax]|uniref:5-hydroxytryptamine receptor 3A-like isoform X3 n=1 Tax=Dicentrarchus labrax TaxID=13489 RepID=UPI0021F65544|nr:5-hydroxytryptamine receptor 3A-like isoform X3 [Dicentrarchus labrax]
MFWENEFMSWNPKEFCDGGFLKCKHPPAQHQTRTEKDKAPPTPYLHITANGFVESINNQVIISTCRMQVYKFPFDIQSCNISVKSVIHSDWEMDLLVFNNKSKIADLRHDFIQYEWLFVNMTVSKMKDDSTVCGQSRIVYTINMKRRSILYIINFLLPVFFFLCLDIASFLISDIGGEKLSFKVTVLLAVTVMQLILNEILPSSSDRAPLIALYCIGIFGLMMLSLVETIVVMSLRARDSQDNEADKEQSLSEDCGDKRGKVSFKNCFRDVSDVSPGVTPSELLPMAKEGSSIQLMEESQDFEKLLKTLVVLLRKEEKKPGYWTRKTKTINKVFFIFYVIAATLFLVFMFVSWNSED